MVKVEVISDFTLRRFDEITNLERKSGKDQEGWLYTMDVFNCEQDLADYLLGDNPIGKPVVKVIEVIPTKVEEPKVTPKKTTTTRKTTTKKTSKK